MQQVLQQALQAGLLRDIDLHSAGFLNTLADNPSDELMLAAALVSRAVGDGHICLPLGEVAGSIVFPPEIDCRAVKLPQWRQVLLESGVVGEPGSNEPLVLDRGDKLYMTKYYRCEEAIAQDLLRRSAGLLEVDQKHMQEVVARLFPDAQGNDWQQLAVVVSALKQFIVISGGPGTGKTTTVTRILALLQNMADGRLRIGLAAPTGKAAVRLQESIISARESLDDDLAQDVPTDTSTLHRLLGYIPGRGTFRNNASNTLNLDVLVLDEASMVDVPLMAALIDALSESTKLILLGDRDQLTSVEAGSLFGDICSHGEPGWSRKLCERVKEITGWSPEGTGKEEVFDDSVVLLKKSFRFDEGKGIASLARAVNSNDQEVLRRIGDTQHDDLVHEGQEYHRTLEKHILDGYRPLFKATGVEEALVSLRNFRILCAVREGTTGVDGLNRLAESTLQKSGDIKGTDDWYRGKPIIIRKNNYSLQLFNGDTGIVWPDEDNRIWAWFDRPDGSLHKVAISRLPEHESAYAITVHQSQGSEFSTVLFMLPETDNPVLCRELLYTGITRARDLLQLYCNRELLQLVAARRVVRNSGLEDKLRQKS